VPLTVKTVAEWWSIEVFHGEFSALRWRDSYREAFIESAITHGAVDWSWHEHRWGVVFEVAFEHDAQWEAFRGLPQVKAALDAVPDRVNGLLIYRGRGGGAGRPSRRPRRPSAGAGALELPEPKGERFLHLIDTVLGRAGRRSAAPDPAVPDPAVPDPAEPDPAVPTSAVG
jgi:hypothetical protein